MESTAAKLNNVEYLDLYGDIFDDAIILTENPSFETIAGYFNKGNITRERKFIWNGKNIYARRKITYEGNFVINTMYLHIAIEFKRNDIVITYKNYREQKNGSYKFTGYSTEVI